MKLISLCPLSGGLFYANERLPLLTPVFMPNVKKRKGKTLNVFAIDVFIGSTKQINLEALSSQHNFPVSTVKFLLN